MSKELTPLMALEDIILYLNANEPKGLYCKNIEILKTALKEKENTEKTFIDLFSENGKVITSIEIKKKLKALEILMKFDAFKIVQVQGQWFIMMGDVFIKAPKIPITEEQALLLTEVVKQYGKR